MVQNTLFLVWRAEKYLQKNLRYKIKISFCMDYNFYVHRKLLFIHLDFLCENYGQSWFLGN